MYCRAAKASLAPQGLFVMCASDLPGVAARVAREADGNHRTAARLFTFSIYYLFVLFALVLVGHLAGGV